MLANDKTWGIDLTNRKMWYQPWHIDKKDKYKTPGKNQIKCIYSISGEAYHETLKYFEESGGDTKKVIELLNNHVIDKRFYIDRETLLDKSRWYNNEYYFYFQMFCKKIIGRYNWHFGEQNDKQLSKYHRIWEKGFISYIPWGIDENGNEVHDLLIVSNLACVVYFEEKLKLDLTDYYKFVNCTLPSQYSVNRDFYNNPLFFCSEEFIEYGFEFFKILSNDESIIYKCSYYIGAKAQNLSVKGLIFSVAEYKDSSSFDFLFKKANDNVVFKAKTKKNYMKVIVTFKEKFDKRQYSKYMSSSLINDLSSVKGACKSIFEYGFSIEKPFVRARFNNDYNDPVFTVVCWGTKISYSLLIKMFLSLIFSLLIGIFFYSTKNLTLISFLSYSVFSSIILSISLYFYNSYKKYSKKIQENIESTKNQIESLEKISAELLQEKNLLEIKVVERTKELVSANEKLKVLDELKTNFFANISHEFRTPLTLLISPLTELKKGGYGKSIDKNNRIFDTMLKNASRLLRLINSILDFTRIEEGKMNINKEKINISSALKIYVSQVESACKHKNLYIKFKDNTNGITAFIDQNLFETAIFNVISNALKFTEKGGITVKLEKDNNDCFIIEITDTGIGIPEDMQEYIFERFHQVDKNPNRKYEGSGIGLALTKEIIELHEGKISVESKLNQGSTFKIILPIGKNIKSINGKTATLKETNPVFLEEFKVEKDEEIIKNKSIDKTKKTILLIEDNIDLQKYISSVLEKKYNIEIARNGIDALEKIKNCKNPSLFISDIMMPEMDGKELYRKIQDIESFKNIPFIFLTARAGEEEKIDGLRSGAIDYINKPFNIEELKAKIENIVSKTTDIKDSYKTEIHKKILNLMEEETGDSKLNETTIELKLNSYNLSKREIEIIAFLVKGTEAKEIANKLYISKHTVVNHISNIYKKIGVSNKIELFNLLHK